MHPIIQTDRLHLRLWKEDDISKLIAMNQDENVMQYFLSTMTEEASIAFFNRVQKHFNENGFGLYVVEDKLSQTFLGYTGFMIADFESDFTPCVEIGWRFNKEYWGQGLATEAAVACLEFGFSKLNFSKVHSFTSMHNHKSEAVMQRIGMHKIGEFNHPKLPIDHKLRLHVHYIIENNKP